MATFSLPAHTSCMPTGTVVYSGTHIVYLQTQHVSDVLPDSIACLTAETISRVSRQIIYGSNLIFRIVVSVNQ